MKITIFKCISGQNVSYTLHGKTIAEIWRVDCPSQWRYKVIPKKYNGWSDRSQDTAMTDVEHILTQELNLWGFSVEFVKQRL